MRHLLIFFITVFSLNALAICDGTVELLSIPDPANKTTFDIESRVYRPAQGPFPVVFILPPIVGETPLDGALGLSLCLSGFGAYVVDVLNDPPDAEEVLNLNVHEDALFRAEVALRTILAQLKLDPNVNQSYGILGASQGGIISSYLSGVIDELKATVLIASGGNIPEILASSEQEAVRTQREERMRVFNVQTSEQYRELVSPYVTLEPLVLARNIKPESTLMFVLTNDIDVPTKNQRDLAAVIPGREVIEINNTHVPGIIEASTRYADRILNFFRSRL